jgi:hypothetical protein
MDGPKQGLWDAAATALEELEADVCWQRVMGMRTTIEDEFDEEMLDVYRRAKSEAHYNATRFLGMVVEGGGLRTARYLLHEPVVSEGYTALWQRGRLDLTVEYVILKRKWLDLFTDAERQIAVTRLREYGFTGQLPNEAGDS